MIVQCPHCSSKYNFPSDRFKPRLKVKCADCKYIFALEAFCPELLPDLFDEVHPVLKRREAPSHLFSMGLEIKPLAVPETKKSDFSKLEAAKKKTTSPAETKFGNKFFLDSGGPGVAKVNKFEVILAIFLLLMIGFIWVTLHFFLDSELHDIITIGEKSEPVSIELVRDLYLEGIRRYWVTNKKLGQLFVIYGNVVNCFKMPKGLIKIEAVLCDKDKASVVSKRQLAGNTISLFQLQLFSEDDIESILNNKEGIFKNNTNIKPGDRVPFVVVFYNPPKNVNEVCVKVVEAKESSKK
ncbi:putative MJ0042 family finger-like domain-containing protein [Desulfovibrionales bacterium]